MRHYLMPSWGIRIAYGARSRETAVSRPQYRGEALLNGRQHRTGGDGIAGLS